MAANSFWNAPLLRRFALKNAKKTELGKVERKIAVNYSKLSEC